MTDREMLELAAKAAGVSPHVSQCAGAGLLLENLIYWSPLTDDGDALRLAVDLCITFRNFGHVMTAAGGGNQFNEYADGDSYAATRRAIVRAAAEIGRNMG